MELTTKLLNTYFDEANCTVFLPLFGVKLPLPAFRLSNTTRSLGCFSNSRICPRNSNKYRISISKKFDYQSKNDVMNVLVHEMVHEYITWTGIRDNASHGYRFREIIGKINSHHPLLKLAVTNSFIKLKKTDTKYTAVIVNFEFGKKRYVVISKSTRLTNFIRDNYRQFGDVVIGRTSSDMCLGYRSVRNRVAGYPITSEFEEKLISTMTEKYIYSKTA